MSRDIIEEIIRGSIWGTPSVAVQPVIVLERWRVFEVESHEGQTQQHFVGYNAQNKDGRPVLQFRESIRQLARV